jgi:aminopeptidase N
MDEGFTSYGEEMVSHYYETNFATQSPYISEAAKKQILVNLERQSKLLPAVQNGNYSGYIALAKSGYEEPMSTHADHFNTNYAYSSAAYAKGGTFLGVLGYMMGEAKRDQLMLNYYNTWKFKHPNVNDFIRVAEKTSGLQLQWLKEYWVNSTKTIDYGLNDIQVSGNAALISIQRVGKFPMPIEVVVTYKDGSSELHYIPLDLMLGGKAQEGSMKQINHPEWKWTHPTYTFESTQPLGAIKSIEIDPSQRMPDINRSNNKIEIPN